MRFRGMVPFREAYPNIEVSSGARTFDLHNDCELSGIDYRIAERVMAIRFRSSKEVVDAPWTKEAGVVLELGQISGLRFVGDLALGDSKREPLGLDFVEYSSHPGESARLRFVLDNGAEITAVATFCRLIVIELDQRSD